MLSGVRTLRSASLMIGETDAVPIHMRAHIRELTSLEVPIEDRRKGYAGELLKKVCDEANACAMTLLLIVKPFTEDGITDVEKLQRLYARHGFEKIQDTPIIMARRPVIKAANLVLGRGVYQALH